MQLENQTMKFYHFYPFYSRHYLIPLFFLLKIYYVIYIVFFIDLFNYLIYYADGNFKTGLKKLSI